MNAMDAALLMAQLIELEALTQKAMTHDGRWQLLQDWLDENPDWKEQVNKWIELTPQKAFLVCRAWIGKKAEIPTALLKRIINEALEKRALAAIVVVQTLYKDRRDGDKQYQVTGESAI